MKNTFIYSLILVLVFIAFSCENNTESDEIPIVVDDGDENDEECKTEVSYNSIIRPLITTNCMPCHNGNSISAPDLRTYNLVKSLDVTIKLVTQNRSMPINGTLTESEILAIKCWVDNGALNN